MKRYLTDETNLTCTLQSHMHVYTMSMMDAHVGHVGRAIIEAWKTGCSCKLIRDWKSHAPTHKSATRESADAYCTRQRLDDESNTIQIETKSPTKWQFFGRIFGWSAMGKTIFSPVSFRFVSFFSLFFIFHFSVFCFLFSFFFFLFSFFLFIDSLGWRVIFLNSHCEFALFASAIHLSLGLPWEWLPVLNSPHQFCESQSYCPQPIWTPSIGISPAHFQLTCTCSQRLDAIISCAQHINDIPGDGLTSLAEHSSRTRTEERLWQVNGAVALSDDWMINVFCWLVKSVHTHGRNADVDSIIDQLDARLVGRLIHRSITPFPFSHGLTHHINPHK